ncbi:MAG: hypothetical protein EXQ84_07785 [Rhodospirillaceae bacterium]|nr:hypothetical protein [Rhodospirillaceae bacterium]
MRVLLGVILVILSAAVLQAADKPLYQADNATIAARIRASYKDPNPFAGSKVVSQMFLDQISVNGKMVAHQVIQDGLDKEIVRFRNNMPDFRIEEREEFVADNGIVMAGRMIGTGKDGKNMDTAFFTILKRDNTGHIFSQTTLEVPHK